LRSELVSEGVVQAVEHGEVIVRRIKHGSGLEGKRAARGLGAVFALEGIMSVGGRPSLERL